MHHHDKNCDKHSLNERSKAFCAFDFKDLLNNKFKQFEENCIDITDSDEDKGNLK